MMCYNSSNEQYQQSLLQLLGKQPVFIWLVPIDKLYWTSTMAESCTASHNYNYSMSFLGS